MTHILYINVLELFSTRNVYICSYFGIYLFLPWYHPKETLRKIYYSGNLTARNKMQKSEPFKLKL